MTVARSSLIMASGTIISRVLGLVRTVLLAYAIGVTTNAADAFGVANQLPNNVYAIIVGGLLNAVLVPQIVRSRVHKDGGKEYIDGLLTIIITVFAAITIAATLLAPQLVALYTHGWDGKTLGLATTFAYWCLPQLFFYGLYSILGEVLNARSSFGPYMWAPVLNNVVAIIGLTAFVMIYGSAQTLSWNTQQVSLVAGSWTLGVAAQALILFFFWKRIGLHFTFNFKLRGLGLRPALKAASWTLGMLFITQIGGLIQTNLTSTTLSARVGQSDAVTDGIASIAVAGTAWLIFMIPHSVGTVSIVTAYFTRMSEHAHSKKWDELKADIVKALRSILAISAIATIMMIVLAFPIARVFAGAQYGPTEALGIVLVAMMLGLVPFSINFLLQRVFYALEDTRTPFMFTSIQIVVFVAGAFACSSLVPAVSLVAAISLVMSASFVVQATIAYLMLKRRIGGLGTREIRGFGIQVTFAALAAGAVGAVVLWALGGIGEGAFAVAGGVQALTSCLLVGLASTLAYVTFLWLGKNAEIVSALASLRGILRR
jgi:putative peptidoglycan lipid II flippase